MHLRRVGGQARVDEHAVARVPVHRIEDAGTSRSRSRCTSGRAARARRRTRAPPSGSSRVSRPIPVGTVRAKRGHHGRAPASSATAGTSAPARPAGAGEAAPAVARPRASAPTASSGAATSARSAREAHRAQREHAEHDGAAVQPTGRPARASRPPPRPRARPERARKTKSGASEVQVGGRNSSTGCSAGRTKVQAKIAHEAEARPAWPASPRRPRRPRRRAGPPGAGCDRRRRPPAASTRAVSGATNTPGVQVGPEPDPRAAARAPSGARRPSRPVGQSASMAARTADLARAAKTGAGARRTARAPTNAAAASASALASGPGAARAAEAYAARERGQHAPASWRRPPPGKPARRWSTAAPTSNSQEVSRSG